MHKGIFGLARRGEILDTWLDLQNRYVIHINKIRCLLERESEPLRFWGNLLADGEEHVAVFHVVFAKSIRLQRAGRVVARVATEVGRCWTLSLILIDLLRRPTPFAARVAPPSRRISAQSNAPEWRNVAEGATKQPSLLPPFFPRFLPVQPPRKQAPTDVQQQFVTQKLFPGGKKASESGVRTGLKRKWKKIAGRYRILGGRERCDSRKDFREARIISKKEFAKVKLTRRHYLYIFAFYAVEGVEGDL